MRSVVEFCAKLLLAVSIVGGGFWLVGWVVQQKLIGTDRLEMRLLLLDWEEAGRPTGDVLEELLARRRDRGITTSERSLMVDGNLHRARFSMAKGRGRGGVLYITEDGILIWVEPSGKVRIDMMLASSGQALRIEQPVACVRYS